MGNDSYTLTFSDKERDALIFALGGSYRNVRDGIGMFITPAEYLTLSQKVMHAKPDAQAARQMSGTAAAQAMLRPAAPQPVPAQPSAPPASQEPATRIRWARDRNGNELAYPDNAEAIIVEIWKIEDAPPRNDPTANRKKVTWQAGSGRGFVDAFCWDAALFPFLANKIKQRGTVLYIVKSGKYTNVVGIQQ